MLKRSLGDVVALNPYYDTTGTIIESRDNINHDLPTNFDYKVKWNQKMERGIGEWTFYSEKELDLLQNNWNTVKNVPIK